MLSAVVITFVEIQNFSVELGRLIPKFKCKNGPTIIQTFLKKKRKGDLPG